MPQGGGTNGRWLGVAVPEQDRCSGWPVPVVSGQWMSETEGRDVSNYNTKQVIIVRKDLQMRKGKIAAQAAHASMAFMTPYIKSMATNALADIPIPLAVELLWLNDSYAKVCVYVNSEDELLDIHHTATGAGLTSHLIVDNGTTEFHGVPTRTCVAVGPDFSEKIDPITGHLPLL